MDTATADADTDTPGTTADNRRPPGSRPGDPRPVNPDPGTAQDRLTDPTGTKDPATGEIVAVSADGQTTEGGMQVIARPGPAKPMHTVDLVRMKVETETNIIVNNFIADAEDAMQKSVNVLGFGRSDPPPPPRGGKTPDKIQALNLPGSGKGLELYKQQVSSASARQDSLVGMDAQVDGTSQVVAAEQAQTLLKIVHIEGDLNSALLTVASKKLKSAEAAAVMDRIAAAVVKVDQIVTAAQDVNVGAAGGGSGSGGSSGGGAGAAGAAGGLGSMLPMLAMLPMALMPMLGQLPELLGQKKDGEEEDEDAPAGQPAPSAAVPVSDPTVAAPPPGAAPTPGENAPQNPAQANPQNNIPYGPASPGNQV
ncbi:hypothetical protein [Nocardia jinanensis]|uniref:Uncharacterized protein n=1 Tax=Nocardia jinanensis TaxID=382504 RepID=A0A917VYV9_9NOCA|nr:hypothetical protein [Nocardia jinanensis]GGL40563.1 hypothetical protein GCM10011588_64140 [Nocardia jinanensis]